MQLPMPAVLHVRISMVSMSFSQTNASTAGFCRQIRKWRVWCCTNLHVWVNRVSETWKNSEIGGLETWCSVMLCRNTQDFDRPLKNECASSLLFMCVWLFTLFSFYIRSAFYSEIPSPYNAIRQYVSTDLNMFYHNVSLEHFVSWSTMYNIL